MEAGMLDPIRRWLRSRRYGERIYVVSGLTRSGKSMMIRIL
jgi:hypothetical protein